MLQFTKPIAVWVFILENKIYNFLWLCIVVFIILTGKNSCKARNLSLLMAQPTPLMN